MNKNLLIFVLYDGIENSVFEGQVLQPLIKKLHTGLYHKIILVSFEKQQPSAKKIAAIKATPIELIILKRNLFLGLLSLKSAITKLHTLLNNSSPFCIYARGPHAGWISLQAIKQTSCNTITIQARGLLAEEYAYTHRHKKFPCSWVHYIRKSLFEQLEKAVYTYKNSAIPYAIEAVSPALKNYLVEHYQAQETTITIAQADLPETFDNNTLQKWRTLIRKKLGLTQNCYVYCYNGSAKAWQCPEEIVSFFRERLQQCSNCFLLILSQDKTTFANLLKKALIDPSRFYIASVPHHEVAYYLAASDAGLLFREKNIINWVSRPTKALEYQAVGLEIIHNNTVAYLEQNANVK